jgi:cytochrome c-type biogenesis protein CcmH
VEARYGSFVLLRPRLTTQTVLLWLTPLLLLTGAAVYLVRVRQRPAEAPPETAPLSAEERRRLAELMHESGSDPSRTS